MQELIIQTKSMCNTTKDKISLLANLSALYMQTIKDINWVGFYLHKNGKLHLGPFQGKVACTEIEIGKGVCGTAFEKKLMLNVEDVHKFDGHIACDSASNSEIVVPLISNGKRIGILDIDSTSFNRFNQEDEKILEEIAKIISLALLSD